MMLKDPDIPQGLSKKVRPCGLIRDYVGHAIINAPRDPKITEIPGAKSDANGWFALMWTDKDGFLELEKNGDDTKHQEWYQETFEVLSVESEQEIINRLVEQYKH
jgi:hypothetical protein